MFWQASLMSGDPADPHLSGEQEIIEIKYFQQL